MARTQRQDVGFNGAVKAVSNAAKEKSAADKMMTTRQIAEQLSVSVKTIRENAKKCLPLKKIENGKQTYWSEEEITTLLEHMKKNNNRSDLTCTTVVQATDTSLSPSVEPASKAAGVSAFQQWYTIEELASLCGLQEGSCKNIILQLKSMETFQNDSIKYRSLGYRKGTEAVYSDSILKALKEYQVRNAVPNAVKDKVTAAEGNISFVQNKAARQTIDTLMDNPDTLQLMLTASIERQQKLSLENSRLKKEKESLRIELDQSREWFSIKRMEKLNPGSHFKYSLLKNESKKLGFDVKKTFDQNYGEVNAYHRRVWESLYFDTLEYGD